MSFFKLTRSSTIDWKRFFVRLFRFTLSFCVGLITLLALAWAIENCRGARALERELASLKAKGEPVDLNDFQYPQIPDEQNLAMIPLFRDYVPYEPPGSDGAKYWKWKVSEDIKLTPEFMHGDGSSWSRGDLTPLEYMVSFYEDKMEDAAFHGTTVPYAAKEPEMSDVEWLISIMEYYRPIRETLEREIESRPDFIIPKTPDNPERSRLINYARGKNIPMHLKFVSRLELASGNIEQAFRWVQLGLKYSESLEKDPDHLGNLVRLACHAIMITPVWQGLTQHEWTEEQLKYFESFYSELNCISPIANGRRYDRSQILLWCKQGNFDFLSSDVERDLSPWNEVKKIQWIPSGWRKILGVQYSRLTQIQIEGLSQTSSVDPNAYSQAFKQCEDWMTSSMVFRVLESNPLIGNLGSRRLQQRWIFQTHVRMIPIVCALERYRLTNQQYPETLQELEPTYIVALPKDPILGGDFKYHLTDDGDFRLYSIGWNAKDDGGIPYQTVTENRITRYQYDHNDWVWPWPGMLR
jgi:hypothetical protein